MASDGCAGCSHWDWCSPSHHWDRCYTGQRTLTEHLLCAEPWAQLRMGAKTRGRQDPIFPWGLRVPADKTTQRDPTGCPQTKCYLWLGIRGPFLDPLRRSPTWKGKKGRREHDQKRSMAPLPSLAPSRPLGPVRKGYLCLAPLSLPPPGASKLSGGPQLWHQLGMHAAKLAIQGSRL